MDGSNNDSRDARKRLNSYHLLFCTFSICTSMYISVIFTRDICGPGYLRLVPPPQLGWKGCDSENVWKVHTQAWWLSGFVLSVGILSQLIKKSFFSWAFSRSLIFAGPVCRHTDVLWGVLPDVLGIWRSICKGKGWYSTWKVQGIE